MNCFEITFSNFLNNLSHALYVIKINRRTLHEKEKNCRTFTIGTLFEKLCTTPVRGSPIVNGRKWPISSLSSRHLDQSRL